MARGVVFAVLLTAASARADTPTTPTTPGTRVGVDAAAPAPGRYGLAVGVEVGDPISATVGWFGGAWSIAGALGTGSLAGPGVAAHVDASHVVTQLAASVPVRIGLGARYYHHGYDAMSVDELPDSHYGVRASVGVALERGDLQLYAEVAPGLDLVRTRSCTFGSGARSVCPHAQASPLFVQFAAGARWFISR